MPETQTYYQEGNVNYNYTGTFNNFPVMTDTQSFATYRQGSMSYANYFNQWLPSRGVGVNVIDRNIEILAYPEMIFPKKILSMSQIEPPRSVATPSVMTPLNPTGTFFGDKFRWFGTLQQIRIPEIVSLRQILGEKNWFSGGYYFPTVKSEPANENYKIDDTTQRAAVEQTHYIKQNATGPVSTTANINIQTYGSVDVPSSLYTSKWVVSQPDQVLRAEVPTGSGDNIEWDAIDWDEQNDQLVSVTKQWPIIKFPMLLSPQFKPWACFRLLTLKLKVSLDEWYNIQTTLPYRLNTLFWGKQDNGYEGLNTIFNQWDRSTMNSVLAKPNPYGGTFKICKNKKIFVNPFKGKSITNWIYSKKRGKIVTTKMWQPGQYPISNNDAILAQLGYYSNACYISVLLAPLNLERDFDSFTSTVLQKYFAVKNGQQSGLTKGEYEYQLDSTGGTSASYIRRCNGSQLPNFPAFTSNIQTPYGIGLFDQGQIYIKTQTKYCEY